MPLSAAITWNMASDFLVNEKPDMPDPASTEQTNPNAQFPAWSYGYRDVAVTSTMSYFGVADHSNSVNGNPDIQGWKKDFLIIATNTSSVTSGGLAPGELLVHPMGTSASYTFTVIRWTAPGTGIYDISASWYAISTDPAAGGVESFIIHNNILLNDNPIDPGETVNNYQTVAMMAGDTIDFVLGPGSANGGSNQHDSTIVNATITQLVPEVSSALLALLGTPLCLVRRRGC